MKLSIISATITFAASVLAGQGCSQYSSDLVKAVDEFCHKKNADGQFSNDLVVPSDYGYTGAKVGDWVVSIGGWCKSPQWIPSDICVRQFNDMCDAGNSNDISFYDADPHAKHRCQNWYFGTPGKK